jgi:hypothetical protein
MRDQLIRPHRNRNIATPIWAYEVFGTGNVSSVDEEGRVPDEADHESVVRLQVEPVKPSPARSDRVLLEPG